MAYIETWARRGEHRIYVRDYPGDDPPLVLMHGFPDNLHLYDRLVPQLNPPRRVVTFDFLGWGVSDKPAGYPYTAANQTGDVNAVIAHLGLDQVELVAHDASGPPAIDWALDHPQRVAALVLLNTYYGWMPSLRPPEAILLFSLPVVRNLARWLVVHSDALDRRLYTWQVGRFISDAGERREVVAELYEQFRPERPAFFSLNADLLGTTAQEVRRDALVHTPSADHFRCRRPVPERRCRHAIPPPLPDLRAVSASERDTTCR